MVLPVRIELTTSALPRMRSTTELRQHFDGEGGAMAKRLCGVNLLAPAAGRRQFRRMAKQDKSKEERLAQALRDNLRRRKAQARETGSTRPVLSPPAGGDEEGED